jgi:hypothetical protein
MSDWVMDSTRTASGLGGVQWFKPTNVDGALSVAAPTGATQASTTVNGDHCQPRTGLRSGADPGGRNFPH